MSHWIQIGGWTLIHFAWQGAVLALAAAGLLRLCRYRSPNTRYAAACLALAAMLVAPAVTVGVLWGPVPDVAASATPAAAVAVHQEASPGGGVRGDSLLLLGAVGSRVDSLLPFVVYGWFAGVVGLLVRMTGGLWRVRRLQRMSLTSVASRWQPSGDRIAAQLGLRRLARVVETARVATPMAIGWLRPVILLPISALANLTPTQVEAILAHELAHIQRHDYLVNVAQTLAETLLFYHPGVWWVSRRIRAERDYCCDDVAVSRLRRRGRLCDSPDRAGSLSVERHDSGACRDWRATHRPRATGASPASRG